MHEKTQRQVCRVVYVLACIVPTVLTVVFTLYFHRPWQERDWQQRLENNLHVRASISQVSAPRPGERELYDVRLADLTSNEKFATVDKLHLLTKGSFHAERIEIDVDEIEYLARTVQSWLAADTQTAVIFKAEKLLLSRHTEEPCEMIHVQIAVDDGKLTFQADVTTDEVQQSHMRLQVERTNTSTWDISLDCREGQLPACLFADFLPGAKRWGDAHFTGTMQLHSTSNNMAGTLEGEFTRINLQAWLGEDSPHRLSGVASLRFDKLQWSDHRIAETQGSLESEPGQIGNSLLSALQKSLFCVAGKKLADSPNAEMVSFEKLVCNFKMNPAGLTVTGDYPSTSPEKPGCLLVSDGEPLLLQPTYPNLPLPYFVQVFCPLEKYWLPGMRRAADLAEVLPVPEQEKIKK